VVAGDDHGVDTQQVRERLAAAAGQAALPEHKAGQERGHAALPQRYIDGILGGMGLDVYAGPLSRYYAGDWLTVVQQLGLAQGTRVEVRRPTASDDAITDTQQVLDSILEWRSRLQLALVEHDVALQWDEDPSGAYFTDKPAWDCFGDLLLWAAHLDAADRPCPKAHVEDWQDHPILAAGRARTSKTQFPHLLSGTELWFPGDFALVFNAPDPTGAQLTIGSVERLHAELDRINQLSWSGSAAQIAEWRRAGSEYGAPLEEGARFCCALFLEITASAKQYSVPVKLDY
jgi:hypothetical protein